jgi:diguanylate cyclase (GGDEF)-like protein/PAS domain S-box-containing protein
MANPDASSAAPLKRRFVPQSLAARASVAISFVFLVAIAAIASYSLRTFNSQLISVLSSDQNLLLGRISENVDQQLALLQGALRASAVNITPADLSDHASAQAVLKRNDGLAAIFDRSIFLFSANGILLAERPDRTDRVGQDARWRNYIKRTIETRQPVISEPFKTNVGDENIVLVLTMPILASDGSLVGILTGSLGLTRPDMLGNISRTVIGGTGHVAIMTRDGKTIMDRDKSRLSKPLYAPGENALFDRALAGFEGTAESNDENGRPSFVSYRKVQSAGWIVTAIYPKDEAYRHIGQFVTDFLWLLGGSTLLVLLAIWALTRYLTLPLIALTRHITAYSATAGRIAPLPGVAGSGSGEVRALTTTFNALTRSLNDREESVISAMRKYQIITENSTDLITRHALDGTTLFASPASATVLGIAAETMTGHNVIEHVHPEDTPRVQQAFHDAGSTDASITVAYRARVAGGEYVWLESALRFMKSADQAAEILCISRNIDERKRMEDKLHLEARTDRLTGLPNRLMLEERLDLAMSRCCRDESLLAVLLIDLDRFKNINDTLGHRRGDELLASVAKRFANCARSQDTLARWGGDEFVVILPGIQSAEIVRDIADRYRDALKEPFQHQGGMLHVTASIGVSITSDTSADSETLLASADVAMYRAKARGGNSCVSYASEMSAGAHGRLSMESALFHATEREELRLHYQPLISAKTGRIVGVEALVRWQHPEFGLVPPGVFIPLAERTGVIGEIGDWVLFTACRQMAEWRAAGLHGMSVSVNISGRQFSGDTLVPTVARALQSTGLPPGCLELELTETLLMENTDHSQATIRELKQLGVSIALDDFGIGYSSLSYLQQFTLDTLKIDRAFTSEMLTSPQSEAIVRATFDIARALNFRTVAEGIETRAQAGFLAELGCDVFQGFYFAKPLPAQELLAFARSSPIHLFPRPLSDASAAH